MTEEYLVPVLVSGSILMTLFVFYITIFMVIQKNKTRRFQMEKKEMEYKYDKELLNTRLEVQEQALNQISQEIHDNIGQALSVAQANLMVLSLPNNDKETSIRLIDNSKQLIAKALNDLRNVSHVLNSEYINRIGLEESLQKEIGYLTAYNDLKIHIVAEGDPDNLSNEKELIIFRIIQEALSNIIKHAKAKNIEINLLYYPSRFEMKIIDDGIGFDIANMQQNNGIGILNMRQRAEMLNGSLDISSATSIGSSIKLSLPL